MLHATRRLAASVLVVVTVSLAAGLYAPARVSALNYHGRIDLDEAQEAIAIDPTGTYAYIAGRFDGIHVVRLADHSVVATIPVVGVTDLALGPDGDRLFVLASGGLVEIATQGPQANTVVQTTADIGGAALEVTEDYIYVAAGGSSSFRKISVASRTVTATLTANGWPRSITLDRDANVAYLTNATTGLAEKVDLNTMTSQATWYMGNPTDTALDADAQILYVADSSSGQIHKIDLASGEVTDTVGVACVDVFRIDVVDAPMGKRLFVACAQLLRINPADLRTEDSIDLEGPTDMAISPDGAVAYVTTDWRYTYAYSLEGKALTPVLSTATSTANGFTVNVTNYNADYSWEVASTSGSAQIDGNGQVTVSGLAPGASATLTVTSSRLGYRSGSATRSGLAATGAALTPTFAAPVSANDSYSVQITNFDAAYTWAASPALGTTIDGTGLLTVSGLAPGEERTVFVTASRVGYASGTAQVTGSATIGPALVPAFGTTEYFPSGFTVQITNYDPAYSWQASGSAGFASIDSQGVLTAFAQPGASNTVTVTTQRLGYASGNADFTDVGGASPPDAPTQLAATPGSARAELSWTEPEQYGLYRTFGYRIEQATNPAGPFSSAAGGCDSLTTETSDVTHCTATGLSNGVTYYFRVAGYNAGGLGQWSELAVARPGAYSATVRVAESVAAGQRVAVTTRIAKVGAHAGGVAGTVTVRLNGTPFCTAAVVGDGATCSGVVGRRGHISWMSTFRSTNGPSAESAVVHSESRTVAITESAVRAGSCPRVLTTRGYASTGAAVVTLQAQRSGRWSTLSSARVPTSRKWQLVGALPSRVTGVRVTDGRSAVAFGVPPRGCRR